MRLAQPYQFDGRYVGRYDDGVTIESGLRGLPDSKQVGGFLTNTGAMVSRTSPESSGDASSANAERLCSVDTVGRSARPAIRP